MTPTRALVLDERLRSLVSDGLKAVKSVDTRLIAEEVRGHFSDSLDLDEALKETHPSDPRWDYLLGHASSERVVGLEPHSAKSDEVSQVVRTKKNALVHVAPVQAERVRPPELEALG